jgi:cell division protease FtsH
MKRARWLLKKYGSNAVTVAAFVAVLFWLLAERTGQPQEMALTELLSRAAQDEVEEAEVDSDEHRVTAVLQDGTTYVVNYPAEYDDELTAELAEHGVTINATHMGFWDEYGSLVLVFGAMAVLTFLPFFIPRLKAKLAVRNKQVTNVPAERFADVEGAPEAIEELDQLVDFLKRPQRYVEAGVSVPRGWLFHGAPGTGKTLTARAVAGEAGVPFFYIAGSEFAAKYIGEGAEKVRALFDRARTASYDGPSIVFIDEIDAIGGKRESNTGGGLEYSVTLNQLLTEMDGFLRKDSKVIVIAATNRRDTLDPALLRAGRLTRHVAMPEPDIAAREAVLRKHAAALTRLDPSVDFTTLARITTGCSCADLAAMSNAAGLLALRQDARTVTTEHLKEALATAVMGHARTSAEVAEEDRHIAAVHEAGHALVAFMLPKADKPHQVTIVPRGESSGATWMLGDDRLHFSANTVRDQMAVMMAGRAAEKLLFGEGGFAAAGAADDMTKATDMALRAVCEWGMGTLTAKVDIPDWRNDPRAQQVADEVDQLVREAERVATAQLTEHRGVLDALTATLLAVETITGDDVRALASRGEEPQGGIAS